MIFSRFIFGINSLISDVGNHFLHFFDRCFDSLFPDDPFTLGGIILFFASLVLGRIFGFSVAHDPGLVNSNKGPGSLPANLLGEIFPKKIYLTFSFLQDLQVLAIYILFEGIYLHFSIPMTGEGYGEIFRNWLLGLLGFEPSRQVLVSGGLFFDLIAALFAYLLFEFGHYVYHVYSHRNAFLWEFHKVHHSAQTMTPVACFRTHPVDMVLPNILGGIFVAIGTLFFNLAFGFNSIGTGNSVVNWFFLILLWAPSVLHHSYHWWSWGKLEYVLMSPANHLLHHSAHPEHFDKNFGYRVTVFDQLFGTFMKTAKTPPGECLKIGIVGDSYDWNAANGLNLFIDPFRRAFGLQKKSV